jgi:CBS domain-containing membrane protein
MAAIVAVHFERKSFMATTLVRKKRRTALKRLTAAHVMRLNPHSIEPTATASYAAEFFNTFGIDAAPVTDEAGRLIGVVTGADLVDCWGRRRGRPTVARSDEVVLNKTNAGVYPQSSGLTIRQIMNPEVAQVPVDASIAQVMESFVKHKVRRLFVTDVDASLLGDISVFDVLRALGECVAPKRFRQQRP